MSEQKIPQYWHNPETGLPETTIRDGETLETVLAEFREQPAGKTYFEVYDSKQNLRKLLTKAETFNHGIVTFSKLAAAFNALTLLNKTRTQTADLEFVPVAETQEEEKRLRNEELRERYAEFESFFNSTSSSGNREREKQDPQYKAYVERRMSQLSKLPADPKLIQSELFPETKQTVANNAVSEKLTAAEQAELEEFAIRFKSLTSEEARHAGLAAYAGAAAAERFKLLAEKATRAGILRTYSNLGA